MKEGDQVNSSFRSWRAWGMVVIAIAATLFSAALPIQCQTFTVLHDFTGGNDGAQPMAGLAMDRAGNFYGSTEGGGIWGNGTVFRLAHRSSGWILNPLYSFQAQPDGAYPYSGVTIGPDGTPYGNTLIGGASNLGTVFNLRPTPTPPVTALAPWHENILFSFIPDTGSFPQFNTLVFDSLGNLYGTTYEYGNGFSDYGSVYELVHSNNTWTINVLHRFLGGTGDGAKPRGRLTFDNAGNLYGTSTSGGANGVGTVYELVHTQLGWTLQILYSFTGGADGGGPSGGVVFDNAGNLYGTTGGGGAGGGTVFELSPAGGQWTITTLHTFGAELVGPFSGVTLDAAGNLYGTTYYDGLHHQGLAYKLTRSGGSWTYTDLHDFTGGSDGSNPICDVVVDANGTVYGTSLYGGTHNGGLVWQITQQ